MGFCMEPFYSAGRARFLKTLNRLGSAQCTFWQSTACNYSTDWCLYSAAVRFFTWKWNVSLFQITDIWLISSILKKEKRSWQPLWFLMMCLKSFHGKSWTKSPPSGPLVLLWHCSFKIKKGRAHGCQAGSVQLISWADFMGRLKDYYEQVNVFFCTWADLWDISFSSVVSGNHKFISAETES